LLAGRAPRLMSGAPLIRHLGLAPYEPTWRAMQRFTDDRRVDRPMKSGSSSIPPVFTLGLNASARHGITAPATSPWLQNRTAAVR